MRPTDLVRGYAELISHLSMIEVIDVLKPIFESDQNVNINQNRGKFNTLVLGGFQKIPSLELQLELREIIAAWRIKELYDLNRIGGMTGVFNSLDQTHQIRNNAGHFTMFAKFYYGLQALVEASRAEGELLLHGKNPEKIENESFEIEIVDPNDNGIPLTRYAEIGTALQKLVDQVSKLNADESIAIVQRAETGTSLFLIITSSLIVLSSVRRIFSEYYDLWLKVKYGAIKEEQKITVDAIKALKELGSLSTERGFAETEVETMKSIVLNQLEKLATHGAVPASHVSHVKGYLSENFSQALLSKGDNTEGDEKNAKD